MKTRTPSLYFSLLPFACCLWSLCLCPAPASAQVNLSGVWNNLGILHEDWSDRLFGPELGDYAGLPVTDAVRLRADTWDASVTEANRDQWLIVDAIVEDPQYLTRSFIRSTHFRKQADATGWEPSPCVVR